MSEERKRYEGEEIQKGLEDFVDRELQLGSVPEENINSGNGNEDFIPELDLIGYDNSVPERPKDFDFVNIERHSKQEEYVQYEKRSRDSRRKTARNDDYDDGYDYEEDDYEEYRPRRKSVREDDWEDKKKSSSVKQDKKKVADHNKSKSKKPDKKSDKRAKSNKSEKYDNKKSGKSDKNEKKKKKKNKAKGFLVILAILFVLIFGGLYMMVGHVYNKMTYQEAEGMKREPYKEKGVINILLIGNDSRLGGDDGRSDAMILVSISDKTKTVTMTSFLRDMYVEIPGHDGNRLNAAYAFGGPELLMETIEYNFDIPVHRYALVNFEAFANLVDAVGGINLDVTNDEVQLINGYLMEYNQLRGENLDYDWLDASASGMLHLNGAQALAYTRNRYIGTDFGRTERQRKVLTEVFKKAPMAMVTNGNWVIDGLFPNLTTNLKQSECYTISLNGWKLVGYKLVQQYVPIEGSYTNATIRSMAVLQVDFDANKRFLKETLYGE